VLGRFGQRSVQRRGGRSRRRTRRGRLGPRQRRYRTIGGLPHAGAPPAAQKSVGQRPRACACDLARAAAEPVLPAAHCTCMNDCQCRTRPTVGTQLFPRARIACVRVLCAPAVELRQKVLVVREFGGFRRLVAHALHLQPAARIRISAGCARVGARAFATVLAAAASDTSQPATTPPPLCAGCTQCIVRPHREIDAESTPTATGAAGVSLSVWNVLTAEHAPSPAEVRAPTVRWYL
jgi:hypothetical protein